MSPTHCLVDPDFARDEERRLVSVRHIVCPQSSVRRIAKYVKKGYHVKLLEIVKLFAEWSERAQQVTPAGEIGPTEVLEAYGNEQGASWSAELARGLDVD